MSRGPERRRDCQLNAWGKPMVEFLSNAALVVVGLSVTAAGILVVFYG